MGMELDFKRCKSCGDAMELEWVRYPIFGNEIYEMTAYSCRKCGYYEIDHTKGGVLGDVIQTRNIEL